tara:strand:- start:1925 stop:2686 length:762 start_codon:yes stop_codon:yes gene_type:complete
MLNIVDKSCDIIMNKKNIKFQVFDYNHYNQKYTCQKINDDSIGLDIISYSINKYKIWEPYQTELTIEILNEDKDGLFVDIGCQLGYYSIISSIMDIETISIDNSIHVLNLFRKTILNNNLKKIKIYNDTVNENFDLIKYVHSPINLLKADIEGYEKFLFPSIEPLLLDNKIKNLILEISPLLDNDYSELCKKIYSYGYQIYDIGLSPLRRIKENTNHLQNLEKFKVPIDNIFYYIKNLGNVHGNQQSNFLFRK